jgi:hypothetical protein
MDNEAENKESGLQTLIAIMIAAITVIAALVAWRASVIEDAAGDSDYAGLRAAVNVEETRALNFVNAYENYGAYTNYQRYRDLGDLISEDQTTVSEAEGLVLESQRSEAHDLAIASQTLFPNKFLNRDGTYGLQRQMGELWADAAKEKDLNPTPQFADADAQRGKSTRMLISLMVFAIGLVFLSLVESIEKGRSVMIALGSMTVVAGMVIYFLVEFGVM